jgi:hypothetical protein
MLPYSHQRRRKILPNRNVHAIVHVPKMLLLLRKPPSSRNLYSVFVPTNSHRKQHNVSARLLHNVSPRNQNNNRPNALHASKAADELEPGLWSLALYHSCSLPCY